jgi:hypothetical protein
MPFPVQPWTYGDERPFDFVLPEAPGLGLLPGREIIPYDLVREAARRQHQLWPTLLSQIVAFAVPAPVYAICPPPPIAEFAPFYDRIKEKAEARGFQPDSVRYKLWRVQIEVEREVAESSGAGFLPAPREAQTELGLRRVDYAGDILHANAKYGALIAAQAQACLRKHHEEAAG